MDTRVTLDDVTALIRGATGDEKHEESSTSTLDALWVLYDRILRIDPGDPGAEDRDRFILSKGHGPIALYAILAAKGFFPRGLARRVLASRRASRLAPRPHPGAGGGGLDGLARARTADRGRGRLALRAKGLTEPRVFVLCGDAELNEGSNWEAILLAPHQRLGNLTLLVVDNHSSEPDMSHVAGAPRRVRLGRARRRWPRSRRAGGRLPCAARGSADRGCRRRPGG